MVKSIGKHAKRRGMNPSDYVRENDVPALSEALEKGAIPWELGKFYKSLLRGNIDSDLKELVRSLPRDNYLALEEAGQFLQNKRATEKFDPYLNSDLGNFFELPPTDFKTKKKFGIPKLGKTGKAILYGSLIACLIGSSIAAPYADNHKRDILDENHNLAVSIPELLDHPSPWSFGNYLGHMLFFQNLDPDRDRIMTYDEKHIYGTNPKKADSDDDNLKDFDEIKQGSDPNNPDMDNDGVKDGYDKDPLRPGEFWRNLSDHPESLFAVPEGHYILKDEGSRRDTTSKGRVELGEGYRFLLKGVDITGKSAYLELDKYGAKVDSKIMTLADDVDQENIVSNDVYSYGDIKIRFRDFFKGSEYSMAELDAWGSLNAEKTVKEGWYMDINDDYAVKLNSIDIYGSKAKIELYKKWRTKYRESGMDVWRTHYRKIDSTEIGPIRRAEGMGTYDYAGIPSVRFREIFKPYSYGNSDTGLAVIDLIKTSAGNNPYNPAGKSMQETIIYEKQMLNLGRGYQMELSDVDISGNKAYVQLYKTNESIDGIIIGPVRGLPEEHYQYRDDLQIHFKNLFCGTGIKAATVDYIKQKAVGLKAQYETRGERVISETAPLQLKDGYELWFLGVDAEGRKAQVGLYRNGILVDTQIIGPVKAEKDSDLYIYKNGSERNYPLIAVHISGIYSGSDVDITSLGGLWQMSENKA